MRRRDHGLDPAAAVPGPGRQREDRGPADAAMRTAEEIGLPSSRCQPGPCDGLRVDLAVEIDVEGRVDGPQPRDALERIRRVCLGHWQQAYAIRPGRRA